MFTQFLSNVAKYMPIGYKIKSCINATVFVVVHLVPFIRHYAICTEIKSYDLFGFVNVTVNIPNLLSPETPWIRINVLLGLRHFVTSFVFPKPNATTGIPMFQEGLLVTSVPLVHILEMNTFSKEDNIRVPYIAKRQLPDLGLLALIS